MSIEQTALRRLEQHLAYAKSSLSTFLEELPNAPSHILDGCDGSFYDAALATQANRCIDCIRGGTTLDNLVRILRNEICASAMSQKTSTSTTRNLMAMARNSARAKLLEDLEALL